MYDDDGNILRNEEGEYRVVDRSPPMDSCSISYQLLEAVSVPGNDTAGLLEKLKHAVQTDLDVDLDMDELEIAWENPMNFWGHVKKLCRIRTSAELLVILEVLRVVHLVEQKNEPVVFLSLVSCRPMFHMEIMLTCLVSTKARGSGAEPSTMAASLSHRDRDEGGQSSEAKG